MSGKYDADYRAKCEEVFDKLDKDDDQCISITELVTGLEEHVCDGDHDKAIDIACDLKSECDKNDDDRISKQEFMNALANK